jgi:hypothetical protein
VRGTVGIVKRGRISAVGHDPTARHGVIEDLLDTPIIRGHPIRTTPKTALCGGTCPRASNGGLVMGSLSRRTSGRGRVPSTSPRLRAPRLFFGPTSVVASVRFKHFERPLNDDTIRGVLVTHGSLSEKQAFECDSFYRDAVEFDRLGILA